MNQINGLYILVLQLTKSEKRYFKLFCQLQQGERLYWQLYELIQREKGNHERIKAAFGEKYSASKFESARKHLYAVLLRSLRVFRADSTLENRLTGQIEEAQILFEKGLSELAITQLKAVQETARQYEKPLLGQWASQLELDYLMHTEFSGQTEESIVARHEQVSALLRQQVFLHQHTAINHLLLFRYFHQGLTRSSTDDEGLHDLLLEEHRINATPHRHSLESRRLHLHFQAAYFLMTGQYNESLDTYQEMETLFSQKNQLPQQTSLYFTYLIDGILTGLKSTRDYPAMELFLNSLEPLARRQPAGLGELLASHRIAILVSSGKFAEAVELFQQQVSSTIDTENATNLMHGRALLFFYGAVAHFGRGKSRETLQLINFLLSVPQARISRTLYTATRLVELLVHAEMAGEEYLPYKIRSMEWKLRSQKRLFQAERLVLSVLKQALQQGWQHPSVGTHIEELRALHNSTYDSRLNQLFDFAAWLTAKHKRLPLTGL